MTGRSPHGERGLKLFDRDAEYLDKRSLPSRGAWIEIVLFPVPVWLLCPSLPSRGAWIEIPTKREADTIAAESLPSRGAWIEIPTSAAAAYWDGVAPLTGSVD